MRLAYSRYSGPKGFTPEEFRGVVGEISGIDLTPWFHRALETTEELDYSQALDWFGLRFAPDKKNDGNGATKPPKAWLGLETRLEDGRLVVSMVKRGTPGEEAGFNVGDEILGIDDDRIRPSQWSKRMEFFRPGDRVSILIARRDHFLRIHTTFGEEPPKRWTLERDPTADDAQKAHRHAWLGAD
jgi:predicted metalloprotease with PDZ domain